MSVISDDNKIGILANLIVAVSLLLMGSTPVKSVLPGSWFCYQLHGAIEGDTCEQVASDNGISLDTFQRMNPTLICDNVFTGQWLCVGDVRHNDSPNNQPESIKVESGSAGCGEAYYAHTGEDCNSIVSSIPMPSLQDFLGINPNLDCQSIFAGQWLCISGWYT